MSHIKKKIGIHLFCLFASSVALSESNSVVYATKMKTSENHVSVNVSESNVTETVKYIGGRGKRSLDPKSERDMEELANSIEFEVYKFNEIAASKTTFVSPAGICSGFKSDDGVDVTNSSSYYMKPNDASENAKVAKYIEKHEDSNVRRKANERIKEGRDTLNKVVCNKR
ncbi:MAG: hypothetical protein E6Z54_09925 [Haemophilus parainfluenzae]|nr:hypothetical protein [Haemophilus parainfluenzae]